MKSGSYVKYRRDRNKLTIIRKSCRKDCTVIARKTSNSQPVCVLYSRKTKCYRKSFDRWRWPTTCRSPFDWPTSTKSMKSTPFTRNSTSFISTYTRNCRKRLQRVRRSNWSAGKPNKL